MRWIALAWAGWLVAAYLVLPAIWEHHEHNRALADAPRTTSTGAGIPGDPLNVGLVGDEARVIGGLLAAGWRPADPVTFRTSVGIARSVLTGHADPTAPVSNLYVFGRRQDLAFEKAVGGNARRRHHVRLWKTDLGGGGDPVWIGAATFDRSVGISHLTGQVTHHIAPEVDVERDGFIDDLSRAGELARVYQVTGVGASLNGRNGGGDRYYTDGELTLGVLAGADVRGGPPDRLLNPPPVRIKEQLWSAIRPLLEATDSEP